MILAPPLTCLLRFHPADFGSNSAGGKAAGAGPIVSIAALVLVAIVVGYLFVQKQS